MRYSATALQFEIGSSIFQNEILYHTKSQIFTVFVLDPSVKVFLIQRFGCGSDSNLQLALHVFQLSFHHS